MGAWIEMTITTRFWQISESVAPLVGAWIEINLWADVNQANEVAPLVGAWIEINLWADVNQANESRSPCGSVD